MATATITTIKDGVLTLPKSISNSWKNREIMVLYEDNRLIVQPLDADWNAYEQKLAKSKRVISQKTIDDAVAWARQSK